MNRLFLESVCWKGEYEVSPYAQSSFYASQLVHNFELADAGERRRAMQVDTAKLAESDDCWLLPHRLGVLVGGQMASVRGCGRGGRMDAQLKGAFTKVEQSPYKVWKPYEVQTGLWKVDGEQTLFYGTLGITGRNGRIDRDNGDLLLLRTSDWSRLEFFIFRGLAGTNKQLNYLSDCVAYIKGL